MLLKLAILGALVGFVLAAENPQYSSYDTVPNYQFKYEVKDEYTGQDFGQEEARSGYNTDGEYTVVLPDGRRQIVTYKVADEESGFVADVRYEGEAYNNPAPQAYKPKPTYKPVYKPEPTYKAYKPEPTYRPYRPEPTYQPYRPEPTYKPTPTSYKARQGYKPRPTYKPEPAYKEPVVYGPVNKPETYTTTAKPYRPVTRTYRPTAAPRTYGPVYKATESYVSSTEKPYKPTSVRTRTESKVRKPISSYRRVTTTEKYDEPEPPVSPSEAPVYDSASVKKRRMRYPKKLLVAASNDNGSLFYGSVKGRVKAPKRDASASDDN